jgi:hypothetical protein
MLDSNKTLFTAIVLMIAVGVMVSLIIHVRNGESNILDERERWYQEHSKVIELHEVPKGVRCFMYVSDTSRGNYSSTLSCVLDEKK